MPDSSPLRLVAKVVFTRKSRVIRLARHRQDRCEFHECGYDNALPFEVLPGLPGRRMLGWAFFGWRRGNEGKKRGSTQFPHRQQIFLSKSDAATVGLLITKSPNRAPSLLASSRSHCRKKNSPTSSARCPIASPFFFFANSRLEAHAQPSLGKDVFLAPHLNKRSVSK